MESVSSSPQPDSISRQCYDETSILGYWSERLGIRTDTFKSLEREYWQQLRMICNPLRECSIHEQEGTDVSHGIFKVISGFDYSPAFILSCLRKNPSIIGLIAVCISLGRARASEKNMDELLSIQNEIVGSSNISGVKVSYSEVSTFDPFKYTLAQCMKFVAHLDYTHPHYIYHSTIYSGGHTIPLGFALKICVSQRYSLLMKF